MPVARCLCSYIYTPQGLPMRTGYLEFHQYLPLVFGFVLQVECNGIQRGSTTKRRVSLPVQYLSIELNEHWDLELDERLDISHRRSSTQVYTTRAGCSKPDVDEGRWFEPERNDADRSGRLAPWLNNDGDWSCGQPLQPFGFLCGKVMLAGLGKIKGKDWEDWNQLGRHGLFVTMRRCSSEPVFTWSEPSSCGYILSECWSDMSRLSQPSVASKIGNQGSTKGTLFGAKDQHRERSVLLATRGLQHPSVLGERPWDDERFLDTRCFNSPWRLIDSTSLCSFLASDRNMFARRA